MNLSGTYSIPIKKYLPLKVSLSVEFERDKGETEEEFFAKSYKKFDEAKEAAIALEVEKRKNIDNTQGLVPYAYGLVDELKEGSERFRQETINLIKEEK